MLWNLHCMFQLRLKYVLQHTARWGSTDLSKWNSSGSAQLCKSPGFYGSINKYVLCYISASTEWLLCLLQKRVLKSDTWHSQVRGHWLVLGHLSCIFALAPALGHPSYSPQIPPRLAALTSRLVMVIGPHSSWATFLAWCTGPATANSQHLPADFCKPGLSFWYLSTLIFPLVSWELNMSPPKSLETSINQRNDGFQYHHNCLPLPLSTFR